MTDYIATVIEKFYFLEKYENPTLEANKMQRLASAAFYAISSIVIVFVNKSVLTIYKFPSAQMLGVGQMIAAIVILGLLKLCGRIEFPALTADIPKRIFPLPILYLCNMIFGLKSTKVCFQNLIKRISIKQ